MYGGGYSDLGNFKESQFSYRRTRNVDTMSHSASFLHLNRLFESLSFCAECSYVFYKGEFNAANLLPASDVEEFFARNPIISIENTQSETSDGFAQFGMKPSEVSDTSAHIGNTPSEASDGFAQFGMKLSEASNTSAQVGKMPSEVSDCFAQFWKMLSETSDSFAQFGIMLSEASDGFTAIETCSFYSVDSYFCTQGFGLILPFFKNLRENLKKNKKTCNFHLVDVFYLLS